MKKSVIFLCLLAFNIVQANAQSLYKQVFDYATSIVNNPKSTEEQIQINQFKVTALNYMANEVKKRNLKKDSYFFDCQAVNMSSFITDFEQDVIKARSISTAKRLAVIDCYRKASMHNSLFNDTDKEKTMSYVNDKQTFTPFSLDTDWEKAYEEATKNIKSVLK